MNKKFTKQDLWKLDWYSWMIDNYYLPNNKKYSFEGYEYLIDICKRQWKPGDQLYIKKSSQCGASELAIAWCLWLLQRGLIDLSGIGYLFPTKAHLNAHLKARIQPILSLPQYLNNVAQSNLDLIIYNNIPWYFRSGNSRAMKSWAAGACVCDEFDEFEDSIRIIPSIEARFNASDYGWIFGLSTPTHPGVGIDKATAISTQYNYYVPCSKCSKKFSPLNEVLMAGFENCVVWTGADKAGFLCPHCREPIDTTILKGEWIEDIEAKNQKYSYSISRLFLEKGDLAKLLTSYEEALNLQEFYNSDLGLTFTPENSKLTRTDLNDVAIGNTQLAKHSTEHTWAGIDVGNKCHYIIGKPSEGGVKNIIAYGTCKFEEITGILTKYTVKTLVIDLRPEETSVKNLIKGQRGFYACDFNKSQQIDWYAVTRSDEGIKGLVSKVLKADRTQSCDKVIYQIATKKKIIFPSCIKGDQDFLSQMCSPMRVAVTDKITGDIRARYISSSKMDHYFFATVYLNLAFNLRQGSVAKKSTLII